jgi:4-oxalocrotonate tautomerase
MPYINFKVTGTLTRDQKKKIAEEFSSAVERITGKPKKATYIVFEEVDRENWAVGDELLSER